MLQLLSRFAFEPSDAAEVRSEKLAIFIVAGACTVAGSGWALMYYLVFGAGLTAALPLSFTIVVGSALVVSHLTRDHRYATYAQIICILYITALIQWSIGGILASGFVLIWAFLGPMIALMVRSLREAAFWFALYVLNIAITVIFDRQFSLHAQPVSGAVMLMFFAMNIGVFSLIVFIFARYFVNSALVERAKANTLLLNILPRTVAHELKETGETHPRSFESASVLFTDFQGFTRLAATMTPEALISQLDGCFRQMDEVVSRLGLEKIKTIGDAYMCAGGLPEMNHTHAVDCVLAALQMQACMKKMRVEMEARGLPFWHMRIGVHTGPLVAGVVGATKFAYDLWGDTVNTASRMESSGEAGRVNVSQATHERIRFLFDCEHRGKVEAKGKGSVEMHFVRGLKSRFAEEGNVTVPNAHFWEVHARLKTGARLVPRETPAIPA